MLIMNVEVINYVPYKLFVLRRYAEHLILMIRFVAAFSVC